MARRSNPWLGIGLNVWSLGLEASVVMGLRTLKLAAGGPAAAAEAEKMVAEKVHAAMTLQQKALAGALGATPASAATKTLSHYRRRVRANRRRLSKG